MFLEFPLEGIGEFCLAVQAEPVFRLETGGFLESAFQDAGKPFDGHLGGIALVHRGRITLDDIRRQRTGESVGILGGK